MRPCAKRLCATLPVLLCGALSLPAANAQVALERLSGPSPFARCDVSAFTFSEYGGVNYLNAEVEPFIAVDHHHPENVVAIWQQDRYNYSGSRGNVTAVSHDGGVTWKTRIPHLSLCAGGTASNGGDYERNTDPWLTIAPNGDMYQIGNPYNFRRNLYAAVTVSRSTDHGDTWSEPYTLQLLTDPNFSNDKPSITADPRNSNFVYAVWNLIDFRPVASGFSAPALFARSTDAGESWEPARAIYSTGRLEGTIGNQVVVLPDGTLVNVFNLYQLNADSSLKHSALMAIRSTDRGMTWSAPVKISSTRSIGVVDTKTSEPVAANQGFMPAVALDPGSGTLYVTWEDARFSGMLRDGIALSKSVDGGMTWSRPVQVNQAPGVQAFNPMVSVSASGIVAVTYYDFRNDNSDPQVLLTDSWMAISSDGGRQWRERRIGEPFDMRTAPLCSSCDDPPAFFVGDYSGLDYQNDSFVALMVRANSGKLRNRTDVFLSLGEDTDDRGNGHVEINTHPHSGMNVTNYLGGPGHHR